MIGIYRAQKVYHLLENALLESGFLSLSQPSYSLLKRFGDPLGHNDFLSEFPLVLRNHAD